MSGSRHHEFLLLVAAILAVTLVPPQSLAADKTVDCSKIFALSRKNSVTADPVDVQQCVQRGWDPPKSWKRDDGKSAGIRTSGSGGFSYGTVQAPEASPGARGAKASVSSARMRSACSFPPRIKIGIPPKLSIPRGSCFDFFNNIIKDKDSKSSAEAAGGTAPPITGVPESDSCPVESDTTSVYGTKAPLKSGNSYPCGGMIPLTTVDLVLNANSNALTATEEGSYYIWIYRKSGSGYTTSGAVRLPTYLCVPIRVGHSIVMQKSVDLTPPVAQMITYNTSDGHISIRLQSRETMDTNFVPPYDEDTTERYLIIPIDSEGNPHIPADCELESKYFQPLSSRQDIAINSSTGGRFEGVSITPTPINKPTIECPAGASGSPPDSCVDSKGKPVESITVSHWLSLCPNDVAPVDGVCPQAADIPPDAHAIPSSTDQPSNNCTTTTLKPTGAGCSGKIQYGVLNRPSLYLPPQSSASFLPIAGRTAMMASSRAGSQIHTQPQTVFHLQATAPTLTMDEGATMKLADGTQLIMRAPATINAASRSINLTGGGELASSSGSQLQSLPAGAVYNITDPYPLELNIGRSVTLPSGFSIPTAPAVNGKPPYIQLPLDKTAE